MHFELSNILYKKIQFFHYREGNNHKKINLVYIKVFKLIDDFQKQFKKFESICKFTINNLNIIT